MTTLKRNALPVAALALALGLTACTGGTEIEAGPATVTTSDTAGSDATAGDDSVSSNDNDSASSDVDASGSPGPTTPEEAAGLTESSLTDSTAPIVTTSDEIEPRVPIGAEALESLVLDDVAGFERVNDPAADRFLDIEAAAALQPDPTEELPLLETRGYQGGWTRAFRDESNNVVITTVYDFVSALEADFYLEDGTITIIGSGGTIYEVATIPDARGFRQDTQDDSGPLVIYGITFTRNNQWYLVYLLGDPATATPDIVLAAAEAQSAQAG